MSEERILGITNALYRQKKLLHGGHAIVRRLMHITIVSAVPSTVVWVMSVMGTFPLGAGPLFDEISVGLVVRICRVNSAYPIDMCANSSVRPISTSHACSIR